MHHHRGFGVSRRRFLREHGIHIFLGLVVLAVMGLVALLMYLLTNPTWNLRGG